MFLPLFAAFLFLKLVVLAKHKTENRCHDFACILNNSLCSLHRDLCSLELDPVPNPPYFSSQVIKATLDYLSKCHSSNHKSLVAILSKTPISIQRILLAICEKAAVTTNGYERHRILLMYHLFVNLLLREVKDSLGGAWAFVLRDIIYTLIHHINSWLVTIFLDVFTATM
uniref:Uncharacterized protein n=1 Tax=Hippocampus comes TaxID=109280 RepID=A0A3Q2XW89_HIPCM